MPTPSKLAELDREIALIRLRVHRQKELIVQLTRAGMDTEAASRLLAIIARKLADAETRRAALVAQQSKE
jgi:hypothetical protein